MTETNKCSDCTLLKYGCNRINYIENCKDDFCFQFPAISTLDKIVEDKIE